MLLFKSHHCKVLLKKCSIPLTILVALVCTATQAATTKYSITPIGIPQNANINMSYKLRINDAGTVVGSYLNTNESKTYGFKWTTQTGATTLPTIGANDPFAIAINNNGTIAGTYRDQSGNYRRYVLSADGNMTIIGYGDDIYDINDSGQIVGTNSGQGYVRSSAGGVIYIGNVDGAIYSHPLAINNFGKVAGFSVWTYPTQYGPPGYVWVHYGYIWSNSGGIKWIDLSEPYDINDNGQVVGDHARIWQDDGNPAKFMGSLGGSSKCAYAINNSGYAVGYATNSSNEKRAFIWSEANGMLDLNTLLNSPLQGWTLQTAEGINSSGQIVGYGLNSQGQTQAFLLTPVPEPSSVAALATGLVAMVGMIRRRR